MIKQLLPEEAAQLIGSGNLVIIDVRDHESFEKGHIEGAIQLSVADMKIFCQKTAKTQPVLIYCYHGISSQAVAQHLQDQGFGAVYSLIGGYEKWQTHHHPTSDQQE
ncbi:MAG: thiosulfate sulfurtransferase GlpE [Proteobacteria bacterium]|nr:thiosulfate sulfurtransferase GlpE [Pseudomonadota bacterium]